MKVEGMQWFVIPDNKTFPLNACLDALAFSYSHESMCVLDLRICLLRFTLHETIFSERSKHSC